MKEETGLEQWLAGAETCGADPTLHHSLQALIETERQREAEMKKRILSSFISVPPTALYLTLDLDESCYGVTRTWGCRETETDRGREGDKRVKPHTAEAQCGQSSDRQADGRRGRRFKGPTGRQADRLAGQLNTWQ